MLIHALVREFAKEHLGDKNYLPVLHGRTQQIKLFVLVKKNERSFWERPLKRYSYTIVAGLDKYVVRGKEQEFLDAVNTHVKRETPELVLNEEDDDDEEDNEGASRDVEVGVEVANCANAKIRINEELGFLELGRIEQDSILDTDLRDVLADTELDSRKMETFEGQSLRLIISVIYSARFALKGHRKTEMEVAAGASIPSYDALAQLKGYFKKTVIPPKMATRKTPAAFLFKCCRVVYNKGTSRLELAKGEVVGKHIRERGDEDDENEEYENSAVGLEEDEESILADSFTEEDSEKLEIIKTSVLIPAKNREERKSLTNKYLQWFVQALTEDQKKLFLDKPLSEADCKFLRSIFVPAHHNHCVVNLTSFTEDKIQGYAFVLRWISDLSEEHWDEVEKAWAE